MRSLLTDIVQAQPSEKEKKGWSEWEIKHKCLQNTQSLIVHRAGAAERFVGIVGSTQALQVRSLVPKIVERSDAKYTST